MRDFLLRLSMKTFFRNFQQFHAELNALMLRLKAKRSTDIINCGKNLSLEQEGKERSENGQEVELLQFSLCVCVSVADSAELKQMTDVK